MNMATPLPAACRTASRKCPREPNATATTADRRCSGRGAADLLLVVSTVAIALGLSAVVASLAPPPGDRGDITRQQSPIAFARGVALWPDAFHDDPAGSPAPPGQLASTPASDAHPRVSATGPWKSPLYPQNGVTLWDRIRVSSKRDRRAFLLGTTIQIHAPETAATPGPRTAPPRCCPRS